MDDETKQAIAEYAKLLSEVERTNRSLGKLRTELGQIRDKHEAEQAKLRASLDAALTTNRKLRRGMVAWGSKAIRLRVAAQHLRMTEMRKAILSADRMLKRAKDRSSV